MISVCMATYNGAKFIKEQIDSILPQLSADDELIISDDGSSDGTLEIIASYTDKRIKLLHHQKDPSLAKIKHSRNFYYATENFENALKEARGDYIFLSDQDDIWKEDKVSESLRFLQNYDIVMSNFSIIDESNNITNQKFYKKSPISKFLLVNIANSHFLGCCMAFRKNVLEYCIPFPQKLLAHDYWIGCLGVKKFLFSFIDEPLHLYRRTTTNVSTSTGISNNSMIYKLLYRFQILVKILVQLVSK